MGVLSVCLVGNKIEFGFQNNELLRLNSLIIRDEPTQLAIAEKNRVEPAHHEDRMEIFRVEPDRMSAAKMARKLLF